MLKDRLTIIVLASLIFAFSNLFLKGYMETYQTLGDEIAAPADILHEWHLTKKAPFEYRMLFPTIVLSIWKVTGGGNAAFYWCYVLVSLTFLIGAALVFFQFLVEIGFTHRFSLAGAILFLLLPPLLLAYTLPVHTREDTLAYLILCSGLILLFKKQYVWFFGICIIGILCRETLLILPFTFLFFSTEFSFWKRAVVASVPTVAWLGIRIFTETNKAGYDPLEGLKWNIANLEQVIVFTFITFGPLWLLWIRGRNLVLRKKIDRNINEGIRILATSAPWVLLLIIVTTFLGGIYNEIRLLYLGFPWVISLSLLLIETYQSQLRLIMRTKIYIGGVGGLLLLTAAGIYIILNNYFLVEFTQHNIPVRIWLVIGVIMTTITLATGLLFWRANKQHITTLNHHE